MEAVIEPNRHGLLTALLGSAYSFFESFRKPYWASAFSTITVGGALVVSLPVSFTVSFS